MGSSSWYLGVWLMNGARVRGTVSWDVFHRLHNDVLDAASEAGLCIVRLQAARVCSLRRGPYGKDGNHSTLKLAAQESWSKLPCTSFSLGGSCCSKIPKINRGHPKTIGLYHLS